MKEEKTINLPKRIFDDMRARDEITKRLFNTCGDEIADEFIKFLKTIKNNSPRDRGIYENK